MQRSAADKPSRMVFGESATLPIRSAIINFSPAVKRLFWWQPELYWLLSVTALLAALRLSFNKYRLVVSVVLFSWVFVFLAPERALFLYLPALIVWTFSITLHYDTVEAAFWRLRYFFIAAVLYAVIQKTLGYFPHEIAWIQSGIGAVRAEGYFLTEEIRSFSFFAGVPEFGFFSAIMMFLAVQRRNILIFVFAGLGIYLAGSRGVMLSTVIALFTMLIYRANSPRATAVIGVLLAVAAYLALAIVLPMTGFLEVKSDASRLLIYGTFNYRVTLLLELVAELNFGNVWYGVRTGRQIFDNLYLTLLNDFGITVVIALCVWFWRKIRNKVGVYVAVLVLSYCLYADALFSVYFVFNALLLLNAKPARMPSQSCEEERRQCADTG